MNERTGVSILETDLEHMKKVDETKLGYLDKAANISGVNSERGATYSAVEENFTRIANLLNAQLAKKLSSPLTVEDVAVMMIIVKLSRIATSPKHEDSWIDIAGYVNCVSQIHNSKEFPFSS